MHRITIIAMILCLCPGCGPQVSVETVTTGQTQHTIPNDLTPIQSAFADKDDESQYVVLAYGREHSLEANEGHIVVDGTRVDVPTEGKVYVLDPALNLHESSATPSELKRPLWEGGNDEFFEEDLWKNELFPLLQEHTWASAGNEAGGN
jgi:hypothetical protein